VERRAVLDHAQEDRDAGNHLDDVCARLRDGHLGPELESR
jgi:hypothetical protein